MKSVWTQNLKEEADRKRFEKLLAADLGGATFSRLRDIVQGKLDEVSRKELSDYDNPAWAFKQAHLNGIKAGLAQVLDLLKAP